MDKDEFIKELRKIDIVLNNYQLEQLENYYKLLLEWNEKINLTRIVEKKEVYLKHFYDSLTLYKNIDLKKHLKVCDIGTGAGFPGIVLKIVFPSLTITLVDSLLKRIKFLNVVIQNIGLENIEAIHSRAEDFARENREKYDIVTSRAVANLNVLLNYSIPLVKVSGFFVPMKANCDEEIQFSKKMIEQLHCKIENINRFCLPFDGGNRTIITIKKERKTSHKYPKRNISEKC